MFLIVDVELFFAMFVGLMAQDVGVKNIIYLSVLLMIKVFVLIKFLFFKFFYHKKLFFNLFFTNHY